jgi:hypothetical protein
MSAVRTTKEDLLPALHAEEKILRKIYEQVEVGLSTLRNEEKTLLEAADRLKQEETMRKAKRRKV